MTMLSESGRLQALEGLVGRALTAGEQAAIEPHLPGRRDDLIAQVLSVGRVRVRPQEVGDGAIALALGIPAGPLFLLRLELLASAPVSLTDTAEQQPTSALARQAWRSLLRVGLDVGNPSVRAAVDAWVPSLLTVDEANAIKALAEQPDPISVNAVSDALNAAEGRMTLGG